METFTHYLAEFGTAAIPVIGTVLMALISAVFYQLAGYLPGFVRAYVERAYREKEAIMRQSIERALLNGLNAAIAKGRRGDDALSEALDHAMRTNPNNVQHFMRTSNMTRDTLATQAQGLALDHGIPLVDEPDTMPAPSGFRVRP